MVGLCGFTIPISEWEKGVLVYRLDGVVFLVSWDGDVIFGGFLYYFTDAFVHLDGILAEIFVPGCLDGVGSYRC